MVLLLQSIFLIRRITLKYQYKHLSMLRHKCKILPVSTVPDAPTARHTAPHKNGGEPHQKSVPAHRNQLIQVAHRLVQPRRHFSTARAARSAGFIPVAQAEACAKSVGGIQNPELTITSLFCFTQSPQTSAHASPSSRYYRQRVSGKRYEQSCP